MSYGSVNLAELADTMRANSERWFPGLHVHRLAMVPLAVFYAMGLAGETGEALEVIKKAVRRGVPFKLTAEDLAAVAPELADVFTYLLLLADELQIDLVAEYRAKAARNEERFG